MEKATKLKDIIVFSNTARFIKKGALFLVMANIVQYLFKKIYGWVGMNMEDLSWEAIAGMNAIYLIVFIVILTAYYYIVGFVTEYVNFGKSKLHKWIEG